MSSKTTTWLMFRAHPCHSKRASREVQTQLQILADCDVRCLTKRDWLYGDSGEDKRARDELDMEV